MSLALYIHIPYCIQKCPYCDFNSYAFKNRVNKNFTAALKEEIQFKSIKRPGGRNPIELPLWRTNEKTSPKNKFLSSNRMKPGQHQIKSIFFGGGTPTTLPPAQITDILNFCFKKFAVGTDCEISIEANPGAVDFEYLKNLKKNGFNRLSLGCQSFNNNLLKRIGRVYNRDEIYQSFYAAKKAKFENISIDLMFGLPDQTFEVWTDTLQKAAQLKPTHFSVYSLTIEKDTPFYDQLWKGELILPSEELQIKMYEKAIEYLSKKGYVHYEISNFAMKGYECRHNKAYWSNNEYLGFGPGAASYLNGVRSMNILSPDKYVQTLLDKKEIPVSETETLDQNKKMGETLMLGLRMLGGINLSDFERRFGKSIDSEFGEKIKILRNEKLLEYDNEHLKLTYKGILCSNEVFVELV